MERPVIPWWVAALAFYGGMVLMGALVSSADADRALTKARRKAVGELAESAEAGSRHG